MSPIPPETLERMLLHGCEQGREPESQQMRELMTRLAISRRSAADAKLIAQLKKGEACSWKHIHAIVKQRLETWWHEWREDEEDEQQEERDEEESKEGANGGEELLEDVEEEKVNDEDSKPLPVQSHDYTGPDFSTFALSCPLPASFTFFSLSLHQRVVLLRCFCDDHLAFAADFATTVRGVEAADARIPPLGSDSWGHRYFFFGFPDWRIYREDNAKPIKPRELKADKVRREQEEAYNKIERKQEERDNQDKVDAGKEEKEERKDRKEETGKNAKDGTKGKTKAGEANNKDTEEGDMSAPSTPSFKADDEDEIATSRLPSTSTAPRFQLLTSSPATLLSFITTMRKSAYSKDKALSKPLHNIYDDLASGKGRKDNDDEVEDGSETAAGSQQGRKRKRKDWGNGGEVAKRSMRLMLVMAEKEEQERQQRVHAEEQRRRMEQKKDESIAQLAERYLQRHSKSNRNRRKRKNR